MNSDVCMRTETLDEVCELIVDCPHSTPKWTDNGYLVVKNQNIRDGQLKLSQKFFTNKEHFHHRIRRAKPRPGDLIFTREAPMGEICMVPEGVELCVGQRQVLLRVREDIDPHYILYAMQSPFVRHQIFWNEGTGSTVSNVRIPVLKKLKIPRLRNESDIANILSTIDSTRQNYLQMNKTLEEMAQAIFKCWFVDFEPTRAKMAGESEESICNRLKLTPEILALFPDTIIDSLLGPIPEGWDIELLGNHINVKHGFAFKGNDFSDEPTDKIVLTPGNFNAGGGFKGEKFRYLLDGIKFPDEYVFNTFDLIVTMTDLSKSADTLGYPAFIPSKYGYQFLHNQRLGKVEVLNEELNSHYVYSLLCTKHYRQHIVGAATGSTVKHTAPRRIHDFEFLKPNKQIISVYGDLIKPLFYKMDSLNQNSETLAEARDTLLPKLLSGEISVGDAVKMAEGV